MLSNNDLDLIINELSSIVSEQKEYEEICSKLITSINELNTKNKINN